MKKWIYYGIFGLSAAVFVVAAVMIVLYFTESNQQQKVYTEVQQIYHQDAQSQPQASAPQEEAGMLPGMAQLYEMNQDTVGWLTVPGTAIDYPVMQTPQEADYYLKRNFYKEKSSHGCIYVYEACDAIKPSDNLTIYGHNMKDGSMFAPLKEYAKQSFWEEHKTVTFSTLYETHTYEIFAVFTTTASKGKGFRYHTFVDAYDEADYNNFITTCKELSLYDTGITPQYGDKLITLSTCEYTQVNGRLVIVARLVD